MHKNDNISYQNINKIYMVDILKSESRKQVTKCRALIKWATKQPYMYVN